MIPHHGYENGLYGGHHHHHHYHHHHHHHHEPFDEGRPPTRLFFKLPRVVPNQKDKFEADDIFRKHNKDMEVRIREALPSLIHMIYNKYRFPPDKENIQ